MKMTGNVDATIIALRRKRDEAATMAHTAVVAASSATVAAAKRLAVGARRPVKASATVSPGRSAVVLQGLPTHQARRAQAAGVQAGRDALRGA